MMYTAELIGCVVLILGSAVLSVVYLHLSWKDTQKRLRDARDFRREAVRREVQL